MAAAMTILAMRPGDDGPLAPVPASSTPRDAERAAGDLARQVETDRLVQAMTRAGLPPRKKGAPHPKWEELVAGERPPSLFLPPPWGDRPVSFLRDLPPILDRRCAGGHAGLKPAGGAGLLGRAHHL
jgi:hypothetical protein